MSNIVIKREHDLDEDECRSLAESLLEKLVQKFGGSVQLDGASLCYRHTTGMKAYVEPRDGQLDIRVKLNFMTKSLAPAIEKQINAVLDKHID